MNRISPTSILEPYTAALAAMRELHDGQALQHAVDMLLPQLPPGRLTLVAMSSEGMAVAAACAMCRAPLPTTWARLDIHVPDAIRHEGEVIVIEPVSTGSGWRRTIERRFPGVSFLTAEALTHDLAA